MSHEHTEYSAPVPDLSAAQLAEPGAVTIVVPTFNESANIRQLLHRITESVPSRLPCEVVFVDDSTDDTPEVIRDAARDCPFPVTVLHREEPVGGLGGAVVEGMRTAGSDWIVVMDGDCQHPRPWYRSWWPPGSGRTPRSSSPPGTSRAAVAPGSRAATGWPSPAGPPGSPNPSSPGSCTASAIR